MLLCSWKERNPRWKREEWKAENKRKSEGSCRRESEERGGAGEGSCLWAARRDARDVGFAGAEIKREGKVREEEENSCFAAGGKGGAAPEK
ncbi:hypothetical protein ACFX1Q_015315 [Malus domestica]